jgi:hypothetical protein
MNNDELLREMDYTGYAMSCRDPYLTDDADLVLCRRQSGHEDTHATRDGAEVLVWPAHPVDRTV